MAERPGWLERILTGVPLVVLVAFLFYNVGLRMVASSAVGENMEPEAMAIVLGTLPLLWVGGRTLLGWSTRLGRLLAGGWALVIASVSPLLWEATVFSDRFPQYVSEAPTHTEVTLVSGGLVAVSGLASLGYWIQGRRELSTGQATRTHADIYTMATDETPSSVSRRSFLGAGLFGVVWTFATVLAFASGDDLLQHAPSATFEFELKPDRRVQITHTDGTVFRALYTDSLTVHYWDTSGTDHEEVWANDAGGFPVETGDTYTTTDAVDPDTPMRVIWKIGRREQTVGKTRGLGE